MPSAFVLMPFSDEMTEVYDGLIRPALEEAGYDVIRADDLEHQQNILKDIVVSIETFDLIVADLTGSNPNVYYEVGLAHARARPTVLLTQDIDLVPFDLKPYRVIQYGRDFTAAKSLSDKLTSIGTQALQGQLEFGSPITDHLDVNIRHGEIGFAVAERGAVDRLADFEEGTDRVLALISRANDALHNAAADTRELGNQIEYLKGSNSPRPNTRLRQMLGGYAGKLIGLSKELDAVNQEYPEALTLMQEGLGHIISEVKGTDSLSAEEEAGLKSLLRNLRDAAESAEAAYSETDGMVKSINSMRGQESRLNVAIQRLRTSARGYADNFRMSQAHMVRAVEALEIASGNDSELLPPAV